MRRFDGRTNLVIFFYDEVMGWLLGEDSLFWITVRLCPGHLPGRPPTEDRTAMPKGVEVGEVSIVSALRWHPIHPLTG